MSTRVSRPCGRLLSNVVFLGLAAAVAAGCSDSTSRFDNLFTSSVTPPQRIDNNGGEFTSRAALAHADLPQAVPQRLDVPTRTDPNSGLFNARNVTRLSRSNGFGPTEQPVTYRSPSAQYGTETINRPISQRADDFSRQSSISRQALPPAQDLPRRATFEAPEHNVREQHAALNPTAGGRLTLDEARELNDSEGGTPLLARTAPQQSLPDASRLPTASADGFEGGTAWTRRYSPLPTQSPATRVSAARAAGPRSYTPPQGAYTADIDRRSTSSITRSPNHPQIIQASLGRKARQQTASANVDPQTVTSISRQNNRSEISNGWSATGGTYVVLRSGETLYSLSRRYGVPVDAIASANNISDISSVRAGQQILIPTYVYSPDAPVSAPDANTPLRSAAAENSPVTINPGEARQASFASKNAAPQSSANVYVVQKGDSLSAIAAKNNISLAALRNANGLQTNDVIRVGQKLSLGPVESASSSATVTPVATLPQLDKTTTASVGTTSAPRPSAPSSTDAYKRVDLSKAPGTAAQAPKLKPTNPVTVATASDSERVPVTKAYTPPVVEHSVNTANKTPIAQEKAATSTDFIWPVRGEILSRFGSDQNGGKNDGINLDVSKGTPVRAAASGEVIYASNGLADYGNLVLVRHSNGYVSAYAHNSELLVRRGDRVRQGQVVAKSGDTGSVQSPQVHFELLNGKKPVNPLQHLPG